MKSQKDTLKIVLIVVLVVVLGSFVYANTSDRQAGQTGALLAARSTNCTPTTAPWIQVRTPNGGETYQAGQQVEVKWTSCNVPATALINILIENPSASATAGMVSPLVPNTGSHIITLPTTSTWPALVYGNNFKIIVNESLNVGDRSDNLFAITAPPCTATSAPSITITRLGTGSSVTDVFNAGDSAHVRWATCNIPAKERLTLSLIHNDTNGGKSTVSTLNNPNGATVFANDGVGIVVLPKSTLIDSHGLAYGKFYSIQATMNSTSYAGVGTFSKLFTINNPANNSACTPTSPPSITVLSPNGGEVYQAGQQVEVKWTSCNIPSTYLIRTTLHLGLSGMYTHIFPLAGAFSSTEVSAIVTLPEGNQYLQYGKFYKIGIGAAKGMSVIEDVSDDFFTISTGGTSLPAGCTSNFGFSPLTGVPCTNPTMFPPGCNSALGYSPTTGLSCNWTQVPDCSAGAKFKATTGQPC